MQKMSDQNVEITEKMMKTGSQTPGSKPCQGFFKGGQGKNFGHRSPSDKIIVSAPTTHLLIAPSTQA